MTTYLDIMVKVQAEISGDSEAVTRDSILAQFPDIEKGPGVGTWTGARGIPESNDVDDRRAAGANSEEGQEHENQDAPELVDRQGTIGDGGPRSS